MGLGSTAAAAARAAASFAARRAIAAAGSKASTPLPLLASEPASACETSWAREPLLRLG